MLIGDHIDTYSGRVEVTHYYFGKLPIEPAHHCN